MRRFRFHWTSGKPVEGEGHDAADAFRRLGYGGGAIRALDHYEEITWDIGGFSETECAASSVLAGTIEKEFPDVNPAESLRLASLLVRTLRGAGFTIDPKDRT